jgi:hypothetical protein
MPAGAALGKTTPAGKRIQLDNTGLKSRPPLQVAIHHAHEITACQSFVSMASGDLKGKMNYRVWPVSSMQCQKRQFAQCRIHRSSGCAIAVARPIAAHDVKLA